MDEAIRYMVNISQTIKVAAGHLPIKDSIL